ncbi:MAG: recombinase family protein [Bacteroidetes bacterium]|jgi:site-specific DNA recombinase|nr:recombinase family protein [Bacteroidota bacterium]MBT6837245.1 recombinase family protein [Bacteroidota bacterium]MBT7994926.1 recombinase family protein [Bacteroidota bacterium]
MKNVILYCRVSTKEQKENGYSLTAQERRLTDYCKLTKTTVKKIFIEDHSAKSFDRPEFQKMFDFVKQNKNTIDEILFVKWDRFSRNVHQTYGMIVKFKKMGVVVNAVEQPIDVTIPENKIILAFYLTSPKIEMIKGQ